MRKISLAGILLCGAMYLGCGADPLQPVRKGSGGTGGDPPAAGSGGAAGAATAGTGGSATAGTGGSVVSNPEPTAGTGGSGFGPGGSGGSGGTPAPKPDAGATPDSAPVTSTDAAPATTIPGAAPYGCANCKRIFDGKTLEGWVTAPGAWMVKDGAMASTGINGDIWTKDDYGDYRVFFQVRQIKGDHKPCTVINGKRPAGTSGRGLGGAQFQPPNGAWWNYGIGGTFKRLTNPNFNVNNWHQCEVIVKEQPGSFRAACCPIGPTPCKAIEVLQWSGPGRKAPFDIMIHNPGLFDEYREIWLDPAPASTELLSTK